MEFGAAERHLLEPREPGPRRAGPQRPAQCAGAARARGAHRRARARGPGRAGRPARRRRRTAAGRAGLPPRAREQALGRPGPARPDRGAGPPGPRRRGARTLAPPHARAGSPARRPARHPGRAGACQGQAAGRCRRRRRRAAHARGRDARRARQPVGAAGPGQHLPPPGPGGRGARRDGGPLDVAARHARRAVRERPAGFRDRRRRRRHPVPRTHPGRLAHPRDGRAAAPPLGAVAGAARTGAGTPGPGRRRAPAARSGRGLAEQRHAERNLRPARGRLCRHRRRAARARDEPPAARAHADADRGQPPALCLGAAQDAPGHRVVGRAAPAREHQHDLVPARRLRCAAHRLRAAPDRCAARGRQPRGRLQRDGAGAGRAARRSEGIGRARAAVLGRARREPGAGALPARAAAQPDRSRHPAGRRRERERAAQPRRRRELRDGRAQAGARRIARADRGRPRLPQCRRQPQGRAVPARRGRGRQPARGRRFARRPRCARRPAAREPLRRHDRRRREPSRRPIRPRRNCASSRPRARSPSPQAPCSATARARPA